MRAALLLMVRGAAVLSALACGLTAFTAAAREITPAERRVEEYDTKIPACFDPAVLEQIASQFAEK